MTEQDHWERQRREIDSYNLFYSSFSGVKQNRSLIDLGFKAPNRFPKVPIRGVAEAAEPDFMSFNGSTVLLAEIKSGSNLPDSYIRQMERCEKITIEDAEEYFVDSNYFDDRGFARGDISNVEVCIVFDKDRYENRVDAYNSAKLDEMQSYCTVLSQSRGGVLQIERGGFDNAELESLLKGGISLPSSPPTTVFLGEEVEKESLAVSICYDKVMPDLKHGSVELSVSEIRDFYPKRSVSVQDIIDVLTFLNGISACTQISERKYRFREDHQKNIFGVKSSVSKQQVDEYLHENNKNQSSIGDF
ncbi:hypothetical protein MUK72_01295 [Halococcus dombrowskii]|uniref:Endonuclease n=1 Tax=Halococcus dombrowskii TaxID=179637 RepID=A0AAV3SLG7_HALDO|nr:hypothetical protein [Halococcus dombrowskii]UOO95361.1 hypothetical protein MUK72_01295 [Halococcus dombrowskii]